MEMLRRWYDSHTFNIILQSKRREFLKNVCLYMQRTKEAKTIEKLM